MTDVLVAATCVLHDPDGSFFGLRPPVLFVITEYDATVRLGIEKKGYVAGLCFAVVAIARNGQWTVSLQCPSYGSWRVCAKRHPLTSSASGLLSTHADVVMMVHGCGSGGYGGHRPAP